LKAQYEQNPKLTDAQCMFALESAKIAIKREFGYAKIESITNREEVQGIIQWCVAPGLERIEKIRKSVNRHSKYGSRGYYEFIKKYV